MKMTKHYSIFLPYFHIFTHTFHKVTPITYYIHIFFRDNYTLPTCGLPLIWHAYPLFQFWHFTHLWFPPLLIRNPLLLKLRVNRYFCSSFMSLSSQNKKNSTKMQEKEDQKVVFVSLSPFTQILNMKNIPKKKTKTQINLHKITDLMKHLWKIISLVGKRRHWSWISSLSLHENWVLILQLNSTKPKIWNLNIN